MVKQTIHIIGIEIGYLPPVSDTLLQATTDGGPSPSSQQTTLENLLDEKSRCSWACRQSIDCDTDSADDWVAKHLEIAINKAIMDSDHLVEIKPSHALAWDLAGTKPLAEEKAPKTRCKLIGREWHNSRSYKIVCRDGKPWPAGAEVHTYFATLAWLCWPKLVYPPKPSGS